MIRVSVEDKGIGISEADRAQLFRPFKQAQRMAGGTGLGLYSLYKRMEALNGYCGIESRSDGLNGSVFWFAFPYRPDNTADSRFTALSPPVGGNYIHFNDALPATTTVPVAKVPPAVVTALAPLRILLVDDSISILKITSRALRAKGHQVEVEENGSLGLERLKNSFLKQEFDVLLTDLQMPVMDGLMFVKRFREYEEEMLAQRTSDIRALRKCSNSNGRFLIIGMSANSFDGSKLDALASGMDSFISKPFRYEDFRAIVQPYFG
jgi:CheY-like chemotaxis protein